MLFVSASLLIERIFRDFAYNVVYLHFLCSVANTCLFFHVICYFEYVTLTQLSLPLLILVPIADLQQFSPLTNDARHDIGSIKCFHRDVGDAIVAWPVVAKQPIDRTVHRYLFGPQHSSNLAAVVVFHGMYIASNMVVVQILVERKNTFR
jgi:hypothetical protein